MAFIGDSTALLTSAGVIGWGEDTRKLQAFGWSTDADQWLGCSLIQVGLVRYGGVVSAAAHDCAGRDAQWAQVLSTTHPNAVVLEFGPFDVADHLLPGDPAWVGPGNPTYDQQLLAAMTAITRLSVRRHIDTIWLTSPHIHESPSAVPPGTPLPENDPSRMNRYNALVREVARRIHGVHVIDLARYVERWPGGQYSPSLRPDGIHFTLSSARTVADWLGPAILRTVREPQG